MREDSASILPRAGDPVARCNHHLGLVRHELANGLASAAHRHPPARSGRIG